MRRARLTAIGRAPVAANVRPHDYPARHFRSYLRRRLIYGGICCIAHLHEGLSRYSLGSGGKGIDRLCVVGRGRPPVARPPIHAHRCPIRVGTDRSLVNLADCRGSQSKLEAEMRSNPTPHSDAREAAWNFIRPAARAGGRAR